MSLIDRMKAASKALFGRNGDKERLLGIRSRTISTDTEEGRALLAAFQSGNSEVMMRLAQQAMGHDDEPQTPEQARAMQAFAGDQGATTLEWGMWQNEMEVLTAEAPDWSPCRFYRRISMSRASGVFGIARGRFGLWREPYYVCEADEFGTHESEEGVILPSLCDLRSGLAVALFPDIATAIEASRIIGEMDWSSLPPADPDDTSRRIWAAFFDRMKRHLDFNGFGPDPDRHAHDSTGHQINIIIRSDEKLAAGKPSKVS